MVQPKFRMALETAPLSEDELSEYCRCKRSARAYPAVACA
ncbi:protein of unknown function [Cupriavidus neocaledonicus]|uniref:Uncharacterized protein n=1 Tax=Cupriavidus neocaledonicus TaxID=1040979 RepID=A0A375HCG2_9BURK|nr:protein of unknown function [Cupriavidus neocaledonicus]